MGSNLSYRVAAEYGIAAARYAGDEDICVTYDVPGRGYSDLFYTYDQVRRVDLGFLILRLAELDRREM